MDEIRRFGVAVALTVLAVACTASHAQSSRPARVAAPSTTTTTAPQVLVPWQGPVEHLFFHTLVLRPELAFTRDRLAQGFRDYFVTVAEFRSILAQLDANGWTLVDIHRAVAGTVEVPPGRRPFVLSEDDVNYYDYSRPRGLGWRLVLDGDRVRVEVRDDQGTRVTDDDLVPIVDEFVADHPEFSAEGAKGVLAVTGYEGVFGERVNDPSSADYAGSLERATAIARRLDATGWVIASHSYGHIDFAKDSISVAARDIGRWKAVVEPVVGPTDVFIFPFGSRPPLGGATVDVLRDNGFTILCDIDVTARITRVNGVAVMARRHIDGLALEQQAAALRPFFDAGAVEDRAARNGRAYTWGRGRSSPWRAGNVSMRAAEPGPSAVLGGVSAGRSPSEPMWW